MTPQEHFEEAESFARIASRNFKNDDDEACALASQVGALHATLALAAFTRDAHGLQAQDVTQTTLVPGHRKSA